jgi:hypothetical protein
MRPIRLDALSAEQLRELDELYHRTHDVRVRTRVQMILLAAEQGMVAGEIAAIVRQDEETVRRRFASYQAEGVRGLSDAPARVLRPRPPPGTASACSSLPVPGPARWTCLSPSGRRRAWPTIWRS